MKNRSFIFFVFFVFFVSILVLLLVLLTAEPTAELTAELTAEPTAEPTAELTAEPTAEPSLSETTIMDFGPLGKYKLEWDENLKAFVCGIWTNQVESGTMDLADLKIWGGMISFRMPASGMLYNSAGEVKINDQAWKLGNPVKDENGNTLINKGDLVSISYPPNNNSAGFMISFTR